MIEWWGEWMNEWEMERRGKGIIYQFVKRPSSDGRLLNRKWPCCCRCSAKKMQKKQNAEETVWCGDPFVSLRKCKLFRPLRERWFWKVSSKSFSKLSIASKKWWIGLFLQAINEWDTLPEKIEFARSNVWSYKNPGPNIFLSWSFSGRKLDSSSMRIVEETDENRRSCSRATIVIFGLRCRAILSISLLLFALFRTIHKSAYRLYSYIFNEFSFFCCSHLVLLFLKGNSLGLCIHSEWEHSQDASLWFSSASSSYLPIIEVP